MSINPNLPASSAVRFIRDEIDAIRETRFMMAYERWRKIGEMVTNDLKRRGHFFNTEQGRFFFDSEQHCAVELCHDDPGLSALLNRDYGINPKEHCFGRVLADLEGEAYSNGRKVAIRRLAHYDRDTKSLYVSRFDGHMYKLDGASIAEVQNGTDDVFFFDDRMSWEPYKYIPNTASDEFDRQLIDSVNFADSTLTKAEQAKLLKLWIMAVFFGSIQPTRIILLLLGEHGSGKTSALRRIQKFIFGQNVDLLSIEKEDGFIATVTTDPIALFDNLDERIGWLPFALSRLATGVTFPKRVLYKTNQLAKFPGVSWLAMTARTVDFMQNQPDLPDRTLVLKTERLNDKQPEGELVSAVAKSRDLMWSELLDQLNAIMHHLRQSHEPIRVQLRMADFASFALQVATVWGCRPDVEAIFEKLEQAQSHLVFEDDPVHEVLCVWMQDPSNYGRSVSAGELHREWKQLAGREGIVWPFPNSKSLSKRLSQLRHALGQRFVMKVVNDSHNKQYRYQFWPKVSAEERPGPDRLVGVASLAEPEPTAGFAGYRMAKPICSSEK